ncbi:MAG: hypothetical protein A2Z25_06245 [Planctomycetes bacterium RBG_16_55_9]|nr:MAG: hypothetical protein A2Z25_06245 [Planctomycetes bacterium RBG_16_55_9]
MATVTIVTNRQVHPRAIVYGNVAQGLVAAGVVAMTFVATDLAVVTSKTVATVSVEIAVTMMTALVVKIV